MKVRTTVLVFVCCLVLLAGCVATVDPNFQFTTNSDQIEPQAGQWQTWVLSSGDELRPAAPPDQAATAAEIEEMKDFAADFLRPVPEWMSVEGKRLVGLPWAAC
jgi:hypothetical protein